MSEPRELLAGLHLIDHQIVDCDGRMAGKVDDLELELPDADDPGAEPPVVVAILSGAGALAGRLEGRLGRWVESIDARLSAEGAPSRVPFELVTQVGSHVTVRVGRDDLETNRGERWARDTIVSKIPGAGHAPE
jgi:sporulation protein YlmC with PRC-barrel domain